MGLVSAKWPLTPRDTGVAPWGQAKNQPWQERRMEVYAAMVDSMDQGIGRIVGALRETGRLANTLVLFLQDNGGCAEEFGSRGAVRPDPSKPVTLKPMAPDALQTRMVPAVTRDGRPVRHQPGHLIDIMATCVDVAGATYPTKLKGEAIQPMEGRSLVPAFDGKPIDREAIYWEHEGNRAVRVGKWKLVAKGRNGPWELYDMEADRTELDDLAARLPDKAKQLADLWEAYATRTGVKPWPGGRKRKKTPKPTK